jgi:hypothetical protein
VRFRAEFPFALVSLLLAPLVCHAQCTTSVAACAGGVPHFVKFNGVLQNVAVSPSRVVAIRFVIYSDSTGGTPLWEEVQNAELDPQGHYEVLLGATASEGIPMQLFTSGEPRWLGVQPLLPGAEEQPRVLLVSVPYALEAADAQTLGGLPASAFAKAAPAATGEPIIPLDNVPAGTQVGTPTAATPQPATDSTSASGITRRPGSANVVPKFSDAQSLIPSQITDSNGMVSMENLSNILFADRFLGGVPEAIKACPPNGCIIYAVSPKVNLDLGTIDPGTKSITIYLGPYTYTVKQVTLRKAMKIIGMGASASPNGTLTCNPANPCNGTALQSVNGNNPVFVIPQDNNDPATNVQLSGFRVLGSQANTSEDAFFLDASSTVNSGLWFSTFDDIEVLGFAGVGIHLRAPNSNFGSTDQWLLFNNVTVARPSGGGNALRLEGAVFELRFRNCQFDGQAIGDGTNIYIGGFGGGTGGWPETIVFEGLISQRAATAVQIDGTINLTFYGPHHESLWGAYRITNNTNIGTRGLNISDGYFAGNVGNNAGAGYVLSIESSNANGITFAHNQIFGTPDEILKGTNFASIVYQDNLSHSTTNLPPTSGITTQMSPANTIDIQGAHSIGLNPSSTPITTIQSGLGPGEMVTFYALAGPVTFGMGGNIDLMGMSSATVNGTITLIRSDLGSLHWRVVSQWSPGSTTAAQVAGSSWPIRHGHN